MSTKKDVYKKIKCLHHIICIQKKKLYTKKENVYKKKKMYTKKECIYKRKYMYTEKNVY